MKKRLLTLAMSVLCIFGIMAQAPQELPINPQIKHGVLPNGLTYYILHNEMPKERANFYIAQKVGSTLETPEQLGLAHFLEHMAFNGTRNYPGKNMLNYLQSKGIRFGSDINAYTSFDETVYNIDNVPTTDKALVDSVLLVLHDWSCDILLEESEINAERGVIEEEWRSRNDADNRMFSAILPQIFSEYQYRQMPIGSMDVVRNFSPQTLRDYYHKWYRPDQQGIVIVGDFDADEMEKKVIDLFSTIPMPENAAIREYAPVSDNKEPIFASFTDDELRYASARIFFKSDVFPREYRNTDQGFIINEIIPELLSSLINNRLSEYQTKPECKYAYAGVAFSSYMVASTKDAFTIMVVAKDNMEEAFKDAMAIVARACKTGFTDSEVSRVKDQMIANAEKAYNEKDKTKNSTLARSIINHFISNNTELGAEMEYNLINMILPQLATPMLNQVASEVLTPENQVIVISEPTGFSKNGIKENVYVEALNNALNAQYEQYEDVVITEPLIAAMPPKGKVTSTQENAVFGGNEYTLSNGVKVLVKSTDFAGDEVRFTAFKKDGKNEFNPADAANVNIADLAFEVSKMGSFDNVMMQKYLSGKMVSCSFSLDPNVTELGGSSTVKDLPTLMEIIYTSFTNLNPDQDTYNAQMSQLKTMLENKSKNPQMVFSDSIQSVIYSHNPLMESISVETIEKASYPESLNIVKKVLSNAADYTFVFVGNINEAEFIPMLEQYIATLPSTGKATECTAPNFKPAAGIINNEFTLPMLTPSTMVLGVYTNSIEPTIENAVKVQLAGNLLSNIYTETLREEEGGTYSPFASANLSYLNKQWMIQIVFQTNSDIQAKLIKRSHDELIKLITNGATAEQFNKVKEAAAKQYDINVKTNGYWLGAIQSLAQGYNRITNNASAINNLTLDEFNSFLKTLNVDENHIQVVMEGTPISK